MSIEFRKIVDISLELDPKNFAMRTPAGFKKDMQFEMEVIKEHDAPDGAGQIVRQAGQDAEHHSHQHQRVEDGNPHRQAAGRLGNPVHDPKGQSQDRRDQYQRQ